MIVDTSALLAFFDADEPDHQAVSATLGDATEPLVVSPYIVAELDYLVASRLGVAAELAVLRELAGGAWDLPAIAANELSQAGSVIEQYADQRIGVAGPRLRTTFHPTPMAARFCSTSLSSHSTGDGVEWAQVDPTCSTIA